MTTSDIADRLRSRRLIAIARSIAAQRCVDLADMLGTTHRKAATAARRELWLWVRDKYGYSYHELGELFERDHSTIMAGIRKAREQ
jgi:chromosomal replication initiation ATPase DnaA